jgi:hypothetical protein
MMRLVLFAVSLLMIGSCKLKKEEGFKLSHNGDPSFGWINTNSLQPEAEGSGNFVSKIDSIHPYSLGYKQKLGDLSEIQFKEITIECDVKPVTDNAEFTAVLSVENQEKSLRWEGQKYTTKETPANQWHHLKWTMILKKDEFKPELFLLAYVWNNRGAALVDNVVIKGKE